MTKLRLVTVAGSWLRRFGLALIGFALIATVSNLATTPASASTCQIGSSQSCPATSPQEIFNLYGTTTDGIYWLRVGGNSTQVYLKMNRTNTNDGAWVLLMKGTQGTTNFGYSSTYFTSNSTTLNTSSLSDDVTADAKFSAYNSLPLSSILAVLKDPQNGTISNQGDIANNGFGGHVWVESAGGQTAFSKLTTTQLLNTNGGTSWTSVPYTKYRVSNSSSATQVFSYQNGNGWYGFNQTSCGQYSRWGVSWNNESNWSSCDVHVGIGLASNPSPGDHVNWYGTGTYPSVTNSTNGGHGNTGFQIWGKLAEPSLSAPGVPTVSNAALGSVSVTWAASAGSPTEYVVQYKKSTDSWTASSSQSVLVSGATSATITGLDNNQQYSFRVVARTATNSSLPGNERLHTIVTRTISFNANTGSGSMANQTVADSVATNLTANSFQKDRHAFRNWNTAPGGTGTTYTNQQAVTTSTNLNLYAMWDPVLNLSLTTNLQSAVAGRTFPTQPTIQLQSGFDSVSTTGVTVTASVSSGASLSGTATAITDASGLARFVDLGLASGTLGSSYTITFSASGYSSTTDSFSVLTLPTSVTIATSGQTAGSFVDGVWMVSTSNTASTINGSTVTTELSGRDVIIEASAGDVQVTAPFANGGSSARTITLKASRNIDILNGAAISAATNPLNIVLWSDSDATNGGLVNIRQDSTGFVISTNGGHVAMGGGTTDTTWQGLTIPSGYARGVAASTLNWFGVLLGFGSDLANRQLISTGGGELRIYGETAASTGTTEIHGVAWEGGEINTGGGSIEINGRTFGVPTTAGNPNFGVGIGVNAGPNDSPKLVTSGAVSLSGTTDSTNSSYNFQGVRIGKSDLDAGASTITINTDRRVSFGAANTIRSPLDVNSTGDVSVTAAQSWTAGADLTCSSGNFSNSSSGTITSGGDLTINCRDITTTATLTASGNLTVDNSSTTSTTAINVNGNLISDTAGGSILVKSTSDIITGNDVTMQTEGEASGVGGDIVLWSDSDASSEGFIRIGRNPTFNSIGGSTSDFTGGGDIHFGGGLDDGAATVTAGRVSGDGVPDGWAVSSTTMGIWIGYNAVTGDVINMHSGGGDISVFGKSAGAWDALAFNWTSIVNSGEGRIRIIGDSTGWGVQLNRSTGNDTYPTKSSFTSSSNADPAVYIKGKSSGGSDYVALLGSYGDAGTDNLLIQATGAGGVHLVADGPENYPALGLQSTAVLSASGKIVIDGGTSTTNGNGAIHFGSIYSGSAQGSVQIGECAVERCSNSLVTSSTADVEIIANRVATLASLSTTVDTAGALKILPAVGSTAFTDFQGRTAGLILDPKLGGLQIGREGDTTSAMRIENSWTITGPISVHAAQIYVDQDLQTTDPNTSPIRLRSLGQVYTNLNVDLVTNGSDVVFWSGANEAAGAANNTVYISNGSTITTNGGKIWLAGGLDDGGANALITTDRGKWSTVVAGDGLPDGYASGENSANEWAHGVLIGSGSKLLSGGGDIFIAGSAGPSSSGYAHIALYPGAQIDSGTGRIAMWGRSFSAHATQGIAMPWGDGGAAVMVTSNASTSDAISIYSDSSAGASWSRGIIAYWFGSLDDARGYQGSQILATASGGGITMTGIGSAAGDTAHGPHGLYLDFIDIMAIDGPITLNGDGGSSGWSMGAAFGWRDNPSAVIRLGGWAKGDTTASGGGVITTPSGVTADFTASSSDVTINVDTFWNRQSSNGMYGVYVTTSGDFKILPAAIDSGLIVPSANFRYSTQNSTDWSFEKLRFPVTPESIQIGRPATTTAITVAAELGAHGAISVYGSALNFPSSIFNESGRGPVLLKSTSTIALAANKIYQTNGSDIVLWASSGGGNGSISVGNGACINTNASCEVADSVATGNIYFGGGAAGTNYPTGAVNSTTTGVVGVSFGTGANSGIKIFSGGGNIEMRANAADHGISSWSGIQIDSGAGSIYLDGTSTAASRQGFRIAEGGTSSLTSVKSSGTAIEIIGSNTSGSTAGGSNGLGIGYSANGVTISAAGGGDIRLTGTVSSTGEVIGSYFGNTAVTAAGGDILLGGDWADLNASRFDVTNGGSIQIKSTRHIELTSSTLETSGPVSGSGGEISVWADTNGDNVGHIHTEWSVCINTINSCSAPATTGGADIVLGGGPAADQSGFFPVGGAASNGSNPGIRLGNANNADQFKLWSGGGDVTIRSRSASTTSGTPGQYWYGGTNINSGTGTVVVDNIAVASGAIQSYGIDIRAISHPISVTSAKSSGEAIRIVSSVDVTADYSSPILIHNGSSTIRTTISATGGGDIFMQGTAAGTANNVYALDISNADILASSGNITLKGNRGVWWNRINQGLTNIGALSNGTASGDILIEGNRFISYSTALPLNFKTSGTLTVKPLTGESFIHALSFPNTGINLTGLTGLTVGAPQNSADLTVAAAASIAGPITYEGGVFNGSQPLTATATGAISILSSATAALNADLTSGVGGIFAKATGRITLGGGASVLAPRTLSSAGGPITLWTTGSNAGITLSSFSKLETIRNGSAGADIFIAGGAADSQNPLIPAGNSLSSSGTAVLIGTTEAVGNVVVRAGDGNLVIRGQSTQASATASGVDISSGADLQAGTVQIIGSNVATSTTNNESSGVFLYRSTSIKSVIEATADFVDNTEALVIDSSSQFGDFALMIGNSSSGSVADFATLRTTGENADIVLRGANGTPSQYSMFLAGTVLSTNSGDVLLDGSDDLVILSRSTTTRKTTFTTNSAGPGGDITIKSAGIDSQTSGSLDVQTQGKLSFIPQGSNSFAASQTFPPSSSIITVGGLIVGSASNTSDLTQGSAVTSSGDVRYLGGAQNSAFNITTTNSGKIEFYPTTTFTKSANVFDASGDILIGSSSSPASTVNLGTSALSSSGAVKVFSVASITQPVSISAGSAIELVSGQDVLVQNDLSSGSGGILAKASRDILINTAAKNITTSGGGNIVLWANSSSLGGEVDTGGLDVVIDSNGGNIVIAGGADDGANSGTSLDGVPDNYLLGRNSASTARLRASMSSGAGSIVVRAQHSPHTTSGAYSAIYVAPSVQLLSSSGKITLEGRQNSGNTSASNQYAIWLGASTTSTSKARLESTSGDILLRGDASQSVRPNRRGIVLFGVDIVAGGDITVEANAPTGQTGIGDLVGWSPSTIQAAGQTLISGPNTSFLEMTTISSGADLIMRVGNLDSSSSGLSEVVGLDAPLAITGSGNVTVEPYATSFTGQLMFQSVALDTTISSLTLGKTGNTAAVVIDNSGKTITGDIRVSAGSAQLNSLLASSSGNIAITTDELSLGSSVSTILQASGGNVSVEPQTVGRDITLGTVVTGDLSLSTAEIGRISATTLRVGTTGNIDVTASLNLTGKVTNLALRAGGDVTGSAGVVITVANLGIDAGGTINFPGNQAASVVALNASAVTYNQSADYTVATVDGIDPEYGYGVKFAISNVPTTTTLDAFMAVTFNPPPTVKILDKFDNVLESNNLSAADYAVTPTLNVISSTGTPTLAGTTATRSGGTFTFGSMNVADATGEVSLTFSATRSGTPLTENSSFDNGSTFTVQASPTFTTASYNIQAGEPATIAIAISSNQAPAGKTGFGITATLKDVAGNTIVAGPHANATVALSISGAGGSLVSGDTPATVAGVADFSALVVGGKVATNYTLTFSVAFTDTQAQSQTVTATQVVTLTHGDATKLDVSPATQTQATGQVLADITVSVLDAFDNLVTSSTDPISVALSTGTGGGSANLAGYASPVSASSGQVVFNTLGINGTADVYTLTFSSGSLSPATHEATITHTIANRIDLVMPNSARNDVILNTQPVVTVYDLYNNVVESFIGEIVLSVDSGSLGGTVSMNASAGVADFTGKGVKLLGTSGSKTVTATAATIAKTDTQAVSLTFGPASSVNLALPAAGFVNRVSFATQPQITIVDSSSNIVEDFAGDIVATVSAGAISLDGTTTLSLTAADLGQAAFSGLSLRGSVGTYTLSFSSTGLNQASQSAVLKHGAPTQLVVAQSAAGVRSGQLFDTPLQLQIQDADGNVATSGDGATATIEVSKTQPGYSSGGADFGGLTAVNASAGQANFSDLTLSGVAGDYDLSFAITGPAGLTSIAAATETVSLAAGSKAVLQVVQQPADAEAGVEFNPAVAVEILDSWANRVLSDSTSTITSQRVSTDNASMLETLATISVSSGLATFTGMKVTTIGDFKLRFSSSGLADVLSTSFTVTHGPAAKLVFSSDPTSARSDVAFSPAPVLRLLDQFNNAVTSGTTFTVTGSVVSANSVDVQSLVGNVQTSAAGTEYLIYSGMKLKAPIGTYKLRYTATDGNASFFIDSSDISLSFGLPNQLNIATPAATAQAGEAFGTLPVIEIQDSAGNIITDSTLRVTASVTGRTLVGTSFVDAASGVADFSATGLGIAGEVGSSLAIEYSIEYPIGTQIVSSQSLDLVAGPARYLHVAQQPTELVTRATFSPGVQVELRDQYQNKVLSDSSTAVSALLYSSNNQIATATAGEPAIQAVVVTAQNGVADFSFLSYAVPPAANYYLKFALPDDLDVVNSSPFTVVPGAVTSIVIDQQPSTTNIDNSLVKTGELLAQMPQVSLYDQDGYLADNASGSVSVAISTGAGGSLSEGSTSAAIASGVAAFSGIKLVGVPAQGATAATDYKLTFSFSGVDSPESNVLKVTHNDAYQLVIQRNASGGRAGEVFTQQPVIQIQDRYGNIVESSNAAIRVGASAGGSVTGREVNAQSGVATFTSLALGGLTTNTYSLTFEIPNTSVLTATQSDISLTYGVADRLVITTQPASLDGNAELTKTGDALAVQPVIEVRDAHGNRVENSNDIVTASFDATFDLRDRLENDTVQAVNGIATFANLTLIGRPNQDYNLNFDSGQLQNVQSGLLQLRHGDPNSIEILTQPSSVIDSVNGVLTRTGDALHIQPAIRILDFDGNHADSASGVNVVATVISGGGTAVAGLDASSRPFNEAVISGGGATFSELKIVATPGVAQQLQFSAIFPSGAIVSANTSDITVTNGLAQALALSVEPCAGIDDGSSCAAGVTGAELQVQPTVSILDAYGNLVVDHVGEVVASVSAAGARLAVSDNDDALLRTVSVTGGYAAFAGLELTATPGVPVKINFASTNLTGVSSRDLLVAAANAARLEMVMQPVGARTGAELNTQPQLRLVDRFGNTVLADSSSVVTATASGGTLFTDPVAPLTAVANQGVVTFTGLKFTGTPGESYAIEFTSGGLIPATSASLSVTNALANNLVIVQQPVAGKTGDLLTQMPSLELRDFDDNLAADDNTTVVRVSIDVSNGAANFVDSQDQALLTAPEATATSGLISFADLRIVATPGTVYKLNFEATPAQGSTFAAPASQELVFAHANPAQVVVTQSAIGGLAGENLTTQPILQIKDRFGNNATGDNTTTISAVIDTGASGDVLRGGTITVVGGVGTFANLALDGVPSETYTLGFDATSEFADNFQVVDSTEVSLSRATALSLSMTAVSYAPDAIVVPTFGIDSPGEVTWTTTTDASICVLELDGANQPTGNLIVKGVGTCALKAQAARYDFIHASAPQASYLAGEVSANLVINKAAQATLTISSADNVDYRSSLTLSTVGGSGDGEVRYFVSGDCRVIGGVLLPGEAGALCEVFARKASDANYESIDSATQTVTINRIQAVVPLKIGNSQAVSVGDIQLFTAGGAGDGAVTYQVSTQGDAACQIIDGSTLRATQNGTCGVMATKAASVNYLVSISPEVTFTFTKMSQVVNFTSAAPARPTPGALFEPVATASSGLEVDIAISTGLGTVCDFDQTETTKVRFLTSGNCVLVATQAGSSLYNAASSSMTVVVGALNQTITFGELADMKFGAPRFQLVASASSSLPVTFALGQSVSNPGCSVTSSGLVTLTAAGMCEIVASQSGDLTFLAAPNVTQMFSIAPDQAGAPHLVSVSVSNQAITTKFRAPSYLGGSQVSAYRMVATNGNGDSYVQPGCSAAGPDLVCELVGMPLDVAYTVKVAAVTAAGIGIYSDESLPVTPGNTEIAVSNLSADQDTVDQELDVTWVKPLALDDNFVSYEVYIWPLNTEQPTEPTQTISTVSTEQTTLTIEPEVQVQSFGIASFSLLAQQPTIPKADSYNLKVVTITDSTSTAITNVNVASGVQLGLGTPGRPRNELLSADANQLTVTWSTPASDGGSEITHYLIRSSGTDAPNCSAPAQDNWTQVSNQPSSMIYQQSGLTAGSTYEVAIFACNDKGASTPAIVTHSIPAPPAAAGAQAYPGPALDDFSVRAASPGAVVTVTGQKLDSVTALFLGSKSVSFEIVGPNELRLTIPEGLAPGIYDLLIDSSFGLLTIQDAIQVLEPSAEEESNPGVLQEPEEQPESNRDAGSNSDPTPADPSSDSIQGGDAETNAGSGGAEESSGPGGDSTLDPVEESDASANPEVGPTNIAQGPMDNAIESNLRLNLLIVLLLVLALIASGLVGTRAGAKRSSEEEDESQITA